MVLPNQRMNKNSSPSNSSNSSGSRSGVKKSHKMVNQLQPEANKFARPLLKNETVLCENNNFKQNYFVFEKPKEKKPISFHNVSAQEIVSGELTAKTSPRAGSGSVKKSNSQPLNDSSSHSCGGSSSSSSNMYHSHVTPHVSQESSNQRKLEEMLLLVDQSLRFQQQDTLTSTTYFSQPHQPELNAIHQQHMSFPPSNMYTPIQSFLDDFSQPLFSSVFQPNPQTQSGESSVLNQLLMSQQEQTDFDSYQGLTPTMDGLGEQFDFLDATLNQQLEGFDQSLSESSASLNFPLNTTTIPPQNQQEILTPENIQSILQFLINQNRQ